MMKAFVFATLILMSSCTSDNHPETEAIKSRTEKYLQALNNRDIDTLVTLWAKGAIYRNPINGNLVEGQTNMRKEYEIIFEELGDAVFTAEIKSIKFPFDEKAVEHGKATLTSGKTEKKSAYKIIFVKENGEWKILNLSDIQLGVFNNKK